MATQYAKSPSCEVDAVNMSDVARSRRQNIINAVVRYRSLAVDHLVSFWAWICDTFNILASYTSRDLWDKLHLWLCYIKSRLILDYREKQRLLEWVKSNIAMNRRPSEAARRFSLSVQSASDFRSCWKDGILLCALIEALVPGSCPRYDLLNPEHKTDNLQLALKLVEKKIGIVPEVDIDEVIKGTTNSEKQIACLVAQMKVASSKLKLRPVINRPDAEEEDYVVFEEEQECIARGMGLMLAVRGRQARFNIFLKSIYNLNIVIEVKGPNSLCSERITPRSPRRKNSLEAKNHESRNKDINDKVFKRIPFEYQLYPGKISVGYTPVYSGQHKLSIIWRGQHIMGSPYVVNVDIPSCAEEDGNAKTPAFLLPENRYYSNDRCSGQHPEEQRPKFGTVTRKRVLRHIITINGRDLVVEGGCNEDLPAVLGKICRESFSSVDEQEEWDEAQEHLPLVQKTNAASEISKTNKTANGSKAAHYPSSPKSLPVRTSPTLCTVLEGIDQDDTELLEKQTKHYQADISKLQLEESNNLIDLSPQTVTKQEPTVEHLFVAEKPLQISKEAATLLDICENESPQSILPFGSEQAECSGEQGSDSNTSEKDQSKDVEESSDRQHPSSLSLSQEQCQAKSQHNTSSSDFIKSMLLETANSESISSALPLSKLNADIKPCTWSVAKTELMKFEMPKRSPAKSDIGKCISDKTSCDKVSVSVCQSQSEENCKSDDGSDEVFSSPDDAFSAPANAELLITEETISKQAENLKKFESRAHISEDSNEIKTTPHNGEVLSDSTNFSNEASTTLPNSSPRNSENFDYFYSYISSDAKLAPAEAKSSSFANENHSVETIVSKSSQNTDITVKPSFSSITTEVSALDEPVRISYRQLLFPSKSESSIVRNRVQEWERVMNTPTGNDVSELPHTEKQTARSESPILVSVRSRKAFWESGCVSSVETSEIPHDSSLFAKDLQGGDVSREVPTDFPKPDTAEKAIQVNIEENKKNPSCRRKQSQGYHAPTPDSEDSGISDSRRLMHNSGVGGKHSNRCMGEEVGPCRTHRGTLFYPQESVSSEYTDLTSEGDRGFIDDEIPDYANFLLDNYVSFTGLLDTERPISRKELLKHDHSPNTDDAFMEPSAPKPEKCRIFGTGMYYGQVYLRNHFQVRTRGAGPGYLTVNVKGSGVHDVTEITIMYSGNDLYDVLYEVSQPGYYIISVKWGDLNVPESPFICKVTY